MMKKLRFLLSLFTLSILAACGGSETKPEEGAPAPDGLKPTGEYIGEIAVLGRVTLTIEEEDAEPADLEAEPDVGKSQAEASYPAVAVSDEGSVALECSFITPTDLGYNFSCLGTDTIDSDGDGKDDSAQPISFVGALVENEWQGEFLSSNTSPLDFVFQRLGDSPTKPTNVEAVPLDGYIDVTWSDNSDNETGFIVYRARGAAALQEVGRTAPNITTFRDEDVDVSETYTYAVEATGAGDTEFVEIDAPVSLRARYTLSAVQSEVGSVVSRPAGLDCGVDADGEDDTCSADFAEGVKVTLSASAAKGYIFKNWQGACEGASSCILSMTEDKTLSAVFVPEAQENRLTVLFEGEGRGLVLSESSLVKCTDTCAQVFSEDSTLTLSAEPERGFFFQGWGGVCTGQSVCRVDVNKNVLVTATFGRDDIPFPEEDTDTSGDETDGGAAEDTGADTGAEDAGDDTGADDTDAGSDGADTGADDMGADDTGAGDDAGSSDTADGTDGAGEDGGAADGADGGGADTAGEDTTGGDTTGGDTTDGADGATGTDADDGEDAPADDTGAAT